MPKGRNYREEQAAGKIEIGVRLRRSWPLKAREPSVDVFTMADLGQLAARAEWMLGTYWLAMVILFAGLGFAAVYLAFHGGALIKAVIRHLDAKTRAVQFETELGYPATPRRPSGEAAVDDAKYRPRM